MGEKFVRLYGCALAAAIGVYILGGGFVEVDANRSEQSQGAAELCLGVASRSQTDVVELYSEAGESVRYETLSSALSNWQDTQTLRLLHDIETASTIVVNGKKKLDLGEYTLKGDGRGSVISVTEGASLTIEGQGVIMGGNAAYGGGIYVSGGELHLLGGGIAGNRATFYGGGIYLTDGAAFSMTGGWIENNAADYGGGLCLFESTANIVRGNLQGNTATYNGGGIYLYGSSKESTLNLSGEGSVHENMAREYGGGICVWSRGRMNFSENAKIRSNHADRGGGGVFLHGKIENNAEGVLTMSGGRISENTTEGLGGGIEIVYGCHLRMTGGKVSENVAQTGGGVAVSYNGSASFGGTASVTGNRLSGGDTSNVYLLMENLISIDNTFFGKLGIGMAQDGVISDFSGSLQGLDSDVEGYELRVLNGKLRFGISATVQNPVEASLPPNGWGAGEITFIIMATFVTIAALTLILISFLLSFFDKKRVK